MVTDWSPLFSDDKATHTDHNHMCNHQFIITQACNNLWPNLAILTKVTHCWKAAMVFSRFSPAPAMIKGKHEELQSLYLHYVCSRRTITNKTYYMMSNNLTGEFSPEVSTTNICWHIPKTHFINSFDLPFHSILHLRNAFKEFPQSVSLEISATFLAPIHHHNLRI